MGKPFAQELACLQATYEFCLGIPLEPLEDFVKQALCLPMVAIGSGGSLSAAHFACLLHQNKGQIARPVTPLEFSRVFPIKSDLAVLFLSAAGGNPDILTSFRIASLHEVRELGVLCTRVGSPLATLANQNGLATLFESNLPSEKDGFLATNSLLAMSVLLARGYSQGNDAELIFPDNLLNEALSVSSTYQKWEGLSRQTLIVLHGGWSSPIAWDIESKFSEAALGNVQITDYRNFGHGRHHWLAKRGQDTSVIALITPGEKEIAERTLKLLPTQIEQLRLETNHSGPIATVSLLAQAFMLVQAAGERQGIDPGRPGVPSFGRKLYNLNHRVQQHLIGPSLRLDTREGIAIRRKTKLGTQVLSEDEEAYWRRAYHIYIQSLIKARFGAIILDYDGTLCDSIHRFLGVQSGMVEEIVRLLRAGIQIGVATGRGKSVGQALRSVLPTELHPQVVVGYYNGAHIHPLTEEIDPTAYQEPEESLRELIRRLELTPFFRSFSTLTARNRQLTFEAHSNVCRDRLFDWVQQTVASSPRLEVTVVRSTRSVDVLAIGIGKQLLIEFLEKATLETPGPDVLCVGDQGRWPGNDHEMLAHRFSLSVDEVSDAPDTCWNLAPVGRRGALVTYAYLRSLVIHDHYARFDPDKIFLGHKNESKLGA